MDNFQVVEITGTNLVPLTYDLRYRVWSKEIRVPDSLGQNGQIYDDHEDHARHWAVAAKNGTLVASARLCVHESEKDIPEADFYTELKLPHPVASINRLVVEQSVRNLGLARHLDSHRIEAARNAGAACIVVAATDDQRVRSLGKAGFSLTCCKCKSIYVEGVWLPVMVMEF
jgi:predicted GNAT family N-acyltransferase